MIQAELIKTIAEEFLKQTDCYLVSTEVSKDGVIEVIVDNDKGVSIDTCADLSRFIESRLDRDVEDYELMVASAGLTEPFRLVRQYAKNLGQEVEVLTRDGRKLRGTLTRVGDEDFEIEYDEMQLVEGHKRRQRVTVHQDLRYDEAKQTRLVLKV